MLIEPNISLVEIKIMGLLSLSSGCSSILGHMMSGDTACIACAHELVLGLSPWSERKQPSINVHSIEGFLRDLMRGRKRSRSRGKGVGGDTSNMKILIGSTHLLKMFNKSLIGVYPWEMPIFVYGLLDHQ